MTKITEIIPDNLPDWAIEAMSDGQLFAVTFDRIQAADKEIARVSLDTMAEGMLDVIVTPKDAAVPDDPVARRDERAVRIIDGYQAKDAELARLREALERLASMEALTMTRAVVMPHDEELIARINFAEQALKSHDSEDSE